MESVFPKFRNYGIKAQVELWRLRSESRAKKFSRAMTYRQKSTIALKWDNAIKAKHTAQLLLERLEGGKQ